MATIAWSQIEAECGDYRSGFVATFRKYEGMETDERSTQNKVVQVTIASFSRHFGIRENTFRVWVKEEDGAPRRPRPVTTARARSFADQLPPAEKAKLAAELLEDPEVAETVVTDKKARSAVSRATDDYYQRQAAERSERTDRKAAADPTDRRVDALLGVNQLGEACERFSRDGNEALRRVGPLPESERYWLTGSVDRAEATVRAARRYLELGKSEFDAELESILDGA